MSVSMAPTSVFKGQAAKDLLYKIEHPPDTTALFAKCKVLSSVFKEAK